MLFSVGAVIVLVGVQVSTVLACEGYELVVNKLEACDATSIFTTKNVNVVLNDECKIVFSGCGTFSKGFKTAQMKYAIKINPTNTPFKGMLKDLDLNGDADVCQEMKSVPKAYQDIMKGLNLPTGCPVAPTTVCSSDATTIDVTKYSGYKQVLPIAAAMGVTTGEITITHDTGNTCLQFDMVVRKKAGGVMAMAKNPFKKMFGKKQKKTDKTTSS